MSIRLYDDATLLERAGSLGRALFTRDSDLLAEASRRLRGGQALVGLVYAHQLHVTIGQCVRDLELIARVGEPEDLADRIHHLPLR